MKILFNTNPDRPEEILTFTRDESKYDIQIRKEDFFSRLSITLKNRDKLDYPESLSLEIPVESLQLGDVCNIGVLFNAACGCQQSGITPLIMTEDNLPMYLRNGLKSQDRKSLFSVIYNTVSGMHFFTGITSSFRFDHRILVDNSIVRILIDIPQKIKYEKDIKIDDILFYIGEKPLNTLELYKEQFPPLENILPTLIGWNSWDFYCNDINMDVVKENLDEISKIPWLNEKIKYIVIDDGWQASIGNWNVNINFKNGMREVAELIKSRGFIPGIWVAPCKILSTGPVSQLHPDWLARSSDGKPCVEGNGYTIDPTHPEANSYIRNIFTKLYEDGFRFFKVDYVQDLDNCSIFHSGVSALDAQKKLMKTIREAVCESIILSCGNLNAATGIVSSMRITLDIRTNWEWIKRASYSLSVRYWMHNRLFSNDPDFLVIRGVETSTDKICNRYSYSTMVSNQFSLFYEKMPINEARVWATMVLLSGGAIFLSDRIKTLTENGLSIISTVFELHNGEAAIPQDLFCGTSLPSFWLRKDGNKNLLAVINWNDTELELMSLPASLNAKIPEGCLKEKWTGETFSIYDKDHFHFKLPPRDTQIFYY